MLGLHARAYCSHLGPTLRRCARPRGASPAQSRCDAITKLLTIEQIQSAAAAAARDAVADAEAQAAILNERLRLLTEERDIHVCHILPFER